MNASVDTPRSRSWLDRAVAVSGAAAAASLVAIALIVTVQILARQFGVQVPASDDFAAWAMAGSAFLALPYAMRRGDHIRITLLLQSVPERARKAFDLLSTAAAFALSVWMAWQACFFVFDSWQYDEVAQGMLRVPLWIPQLSMAIGMALMALVLGDRLWCVLRGVPTSDAGASDDATRHE